MAKLFEDHKVETAEATYDVRDITNPDEELMNVGRIRIEGFTNLDEQGNLTPQSQNVGGDVLVDKTWLGVVPYVELNPAKVQIDAKIALCDRQIRKSKEAIDGR